MPNEPNWLPIDVVIEHNRLELAETGENHFVRDIGLLESACARPRNFFGFGEEDIVVLAVSLMAGIARAHACNCKIASRKRSKRPRAGRVALLVLAAPLQFASAAAHRTAPRIVAVVVEDQVRVAARQS